jgi:HSP20 family protein
MSTLAGGLAPGNGQSSTWLPAVDVWETDDELVLAFDLPGIPEDKITVELDDNVLTVSGERERTQEHSSDRFYRFERRYGTFSRSMTLPAGVTERDIAAIQGRCARGVRPQARRAEAEAHPRRDIGDRGQVDS